MTGAPLRLLLVDDHPVVRRGLAAAIEEEPDLVVVAQASSGEEAIELHAAHHPDVTLLDLRLPGLGGPEVIQHVRAEVPEARFVVLTSYDDDDDVRRALAAGARAYLLKGAAFSTIVETIRAVARGELRVPARRPAVGGAFDLSVRERQVLEHIAGGESNREIAVALGIGEETVKSHVARVLGKLEARDRAAAVAVAIRRGLIRAPRG